MVSRETCTPSPGVNLSGMREDFLQLSIGQDTYLCLLLMPAKREDDSQSDISIGQIENEEGGDTGPESSQLMVIDEKHDSVNRNSPGLPDPISLEIYLQYLFHETMLLKARERRSHAPSLVSGQTAGQGGNLLGHFCLTIAHRIFSKKVLSELESLVLPYQFIYFFLKQYKDTFIITDLIKCLQVGRVPYLHLLSLPTWHSRASSWSISLKVPQSILRSGRRIKTLDNHNIRNGARLQFHIKVTVNDDQISVSAEGAPSIISSFEGTATDFFAINSYRCELEDLPMTLLQQV